MTFILRKRLRTTVLNKKRRNRRHKRNHEKSGLYAVIISVIALFVVVIICVISHFYNVRKVQKPLPQINIEEKFLDINTYSRPGIELKRVSGIVVHYTANPGTDAVANRNYFNNLPSINEKKEQKTYVSSHFVIGLEGEIVQCIPLNEIAYASNDRNTDTISIECCHKRKNGKFTQQTYQSLVKLTSYLCIKYDLEAEDVIRHYDVTGKNCPKYFVEHEDAWNQFRNDITTAITD